MLYLLRFRGGAILLKRNGWGRGWKDEGKGCVEHEAGGGGAVEVFCDLKDSWEAESFCVIWVLR